MAETTGWPPSALMQDDCKPLSKWLSKRACSICWKRKAKEICMADPTDAQLRKLLPTKILARDEPPKVQVWLTQKDALAYARAVLAKWGAPTHKPLTEAQRNEIWEEHSYADGDGWVVDCDSIIDAVEAAHGIKGT